MCTALAASAQGTQIEETFHRGIQALRNGQLEEAAENFSKVTELAPGFAEAYLNLGLVRVEQGEAAKAIPALEKSLKLKPRLRGANLFLGMAYHREGRDAEAETALKREVQLDPSSATAYMWLGIVQMAHGEPEQAVVSLDKAATLSPKDVDILYHRGKAHMLVSKKSYEQMYEVDPKSWRVHQVLAESFTEADRLEEAIKECQEAIRLKPNEPGLHEQLGDIYFWKQNQLEKAETEFADELKIDPESTSATYKLGLVNLERSKPAVAAGLLKQVLRRTPDSSDAHYQLGRAEAQLGDNDAAVNDFTAVVKQPDKADPETLRQSYYQLAQIYRRLQKPEESRQALNSFLRLKQEADAQEAHKLEDKLKRSGRETTTTQ